MRTLNRLCLTVAAVALAAVPAFADSVTLGGTVTLANADGTADVNLTSSEFTYLGPIDASFTSSSGPFGDGTTLSLNTALSPNIVNGGSGSVLGTSYPVLDIGGSLFLNSSVMLPATATAGEFVTLTAPFSASGVLDFGTTQQSIINGNGFFQANVTGSGTATVTLQAGPEFAGFPTAPFEFRHISFAFASPSPTPEPASLILLGIGIVGGTLKRIALG